MGAASMRPYDRQRQEHNQQQTRRRDGGATKPAKPSLTATTAALPKSLRSGCATATERSRGFAAFFAFFGFGRHGAKQGFAGAARRLLFDALLQCGDEVDYGRLLSVLRRGDGLTMRFRIDEVLERFLICIVIFLRLEWASQVFDELKRKRLFLLANLGLVFSSVIVRFANFVLIEHRV